MSPLRSGFRRSTLGSVTAWCPDSWIFLFLVKLFKFCALFSVSVDIGHFYPPPQLTGSRRWLQQYFSKTSMFIDRNLDTPPGEITATPLSYYLQWVEEDAMGKLWWFAMFVIFCIIFPVVAVITIGIMLAFIMGGSALWRWDTNSRRPAWLADGFIGRSSQSLFVLCSRWWFFFGWRSFVPLSWAAAQRDYGNPSIYIGSMSSRNLDFFRRCNV